MEISKGPEHQPLGLMYVANCIGEYYRGYEEPIRIQASILLQLSAGPEDQQELCETVSVELGVPQERVKKILISVGFWNLQEEMGFKIIARRNQIFLIKNPKNLSPPTKARNIVSVCDTSCNGVVILL